MNEKFDPDEVSRVVVVGAATDDVRALADARRQAKEAGRFDAWRRAYAELRRDRVPVGTAALSALARVLCPGETKRTG